MSDKLKDVEAKREANIKKREEQRKLGKQQSDSKVATTPRSAQKSRSADKAVEEQHKPETQQSETKKPTRPGSPEKVASDSRKAARQQSEDKKTTRSNTPGKQDLTRHQSEDKKTTRPNTPGKQDDTNRTAKEDPALVSPVHKTQDDKKLTAQEIEAKREANLKRREEQRKAEKPRSDGKKTTRPDSPRSKEVEDKIVTESRKPGRQQSEEKKITRPNTPGRQDLANTSEKGDTTLTSPAQKTQDDRKPTAQDIEAKREANLKRREEQRKLEKQQGGKKHASRPNTPNTRDVAKDDPTATSQPENSEDDKKSDAQDVEAKRAANFKKREEQRHQGSDVHESRKAAKLNHSNEQDAMDTAATEDSSATSPRRPESPMRQNRDEEELPHWKPLDPESRKQEITDAQHQVRVLEDEKKNLDLTRAQREHQLFSKGMDLQETEVEELRQEERDVRVANLREQVALRLRIEIAEDEEREEAEKREREKQEKARLLAGGTEADRQAALKKIFQLEELRFDDSEASRVRVLQLQERQKELEEREQEEVAKIQTAHLGQATTTDLNDKMNYEAEARRLEHMLYNDMENAVTMGAQLRLQQEEEENTKIEELTRAEFYQKKMYISKLRQNQYQEQLANSLRSHSGKGTVPDPKGRLHRRRLRWGTPRAMRPDIRNQFMWDEKWQESLEFEANVNQEQSRILEVSLALRQKQTDVFEQRKLLSQSIEEISRLKLLDALSSDTERCATCDSNLASLQPLAKALRGIVSAIYDAPLETDGTLGRDVLPTVVNVLQKTAHIDPGIAELECCLPKDVQSMAAELYPRVDDDLVERLIKEGALAQPNLSAETNKKKRDGAWNPMAPISPISVSQLESPRQELTNGTKLKGALAAASPEETSTSKMQSRGQAKARIKPSSASAASNQPDPPTSSTKERIKPVSSSATNQSSSSNQLSGRVTAGADLAKQAASTTPRGSRGSASKASNAQRSESRELRSPRTIPQQAAEKTKEQELEAKREANIKKREESKATNVQRSRSKEPSSPRATPQQSAEKTKEKDLEAKRDANIKKRDESKASNAQRSRSREPGSPRDTPQQSAEKAKEQDLEAKREANIKKREEARRAKATRQPSDSKSLDLA